jgi:hypothetical protein
VLPTCPATRPSEPSRKGGQEAGRGGSGSLRRGRRFRTPSRRTGRASLGILTGLVVSLLLYGCDDLTTTGPVELQSDETLASLQYHADLPTLSQVVRHWGRDMDLSGPLGQWEASWKDMGAVRGEGRDLSSGEALRAESREAVAHLVAPRMTPEDVASLLDELDQTLTRIPRLLEAGSHAHLSPTLSLALHDRDRGEAALQADEVRIALLHIMTAADRLRATTPSTLARELLHEAEETFRRVWGDDPYREEERRRVRRLLAGAETALDEQAPVLALRRAWYALRLMDGAGEP